MKNKFVEIDGRRIGLDYEPYIVAELSANHNGDLKEALKTIEEAAKCGADAIKIQTYTPDTMTIDCDKDDFQIKGGLWDGHNLYELYKWAHTPFEWHPALFEKAKEVGITLFSTPFDETAVELLEALNTPAYKVASFELTDLPLIKRIAETGKPIIMSTGMANITEIEEAISTARDNGCDELIVLHCISAYPAPFEQANLATIADIATRFNVITGLSDHTLGTTAAIASVALGACFIEKHFILDRSKKGPDSEFSIEPEQLESIVSQSKEVYKSIGNVGYELKSAESENLKFRRSIYFIEDVSVGTIITKKHIKRIRPGYGLACKYYDTLIGRKAAVDITRGTAAKWELVDE